MKSNMQKIDLSTYPEHRELVLLPYLHMLWSQAPHPLPFLVEVGLAGPCPVSSCADLLPLAKAHGQRGWGHSAQPWVLCFTPPGCRKYPKLKVLLPFQNISPSSTALHAKISPKSAAGIQCTCPKKRFQTCSHTAL